MNWQQNSLLLKHISFLILAKSTGELMCHLRRFSTQLGDLYDFITIHENNNFIETSVKESVL